MNTCVSGLIRRYDLVGPRYTSYPTAPQFHSGIGPQKFHTALRESRDAARPLSLYVHLPFCANVCFYCGCNKAITRDRRKSAPYLDRRRWRQIWTATRKSWSSCISAAARRLFLTLPSCAV